MKKMYVLLTLTMVFSLAHAEKIKVGDYPFKAADLPTIELHSTDYETVPYIKQVVVEYNDVDVEDDIKKLSLENFQTAITTSNLSYKKNGKVKSQQTDIYINGVLCKSVVKTKGFFRKNTSESFCNFSYEKVAVESKDELGAKIMKTRHRYYLNL